MFENEERKTREGRQKKSGPSLCGEGVAHLGVSLCEKAHEAEAEGAERWRCTGCLGETAMIL